MDVEPIDPAGAVEAPTEALAEAAAMPIILASTSRAMDAGHLAAADIEAITRTAQIESRLVGGNSISLLVWAYGMTGTVPDRETNDADLGVPALAAASEELVDALQRCGYEQAQGNRFIRDVDHDSGQLTLTIDVLIPSYSGRLETNQPFGDLSVDAIPGLSVAIARPAILVEVTTTLTTGENLTYEVQLPNPIAALCMKAYAYRWRFADRDAIDIWRLLEVVRAAGFTKDDWPAGVVGRDSSKVLRDHFATPKGGGVVAATKEAAEQTRIRALVQSLVPDEQEGSGRRRGQGE